MRLPSILTLSAILLASELLLVLNKRSKNRASAPDRLTLPLLWAVITLSIWAGFYLRAAFPGADFSHRRTIYLIGLALFAVGLVIRWSAILHLGRFFTVNVAIAKDHELVTTGPYRFVRHPSYTGTLLIFLGFGLCLLNFFSLLAIFVPITIAFLWRMRVEEAALREAFGQRYESYARSTARLVPWLAWRGK
jgi:protein-S-isoprenylcysteine O-methyltransferase